MNSRKIFLLIIFIIVISGVLFLIYYFSNVTDEELDKKYTKINIESYDNYNNRIKANYEIYVDNSLMFEGITTTSGARQHTIPINSSITTIGKQKGFYNYLSSPKISTPEPMRVNIELKKVGFLEVKTFNLLRDKNVTLDLRAVGFIKNLFVCEEHSFSILKVNFKDLIKIDKNCYEIGDLKSEQREIFLTYDTYSQLRNNDEVRLYFNDRDEDFNGLIEENVGIEEKEIIIKF